MSEAEAFAASGNYHEVFNFSHAPIKFNFPESDNSFRRFGLTSITTCLESSNVLLVNFMLSTDLPCQTGCLAGV